MLGHSTGGWVALDFAVSYPERLDALVLFGSIAGGFDYSPEFAGALGDIFTTAQAQGIDAARELWLRLLAFQPGDGSLPESELLRIVGDYSGWHWVNADPWRSL
ncbi:MAG TPA: hypothetical protein VF541_17360, partial [Longimicrobium sp.]